MAPGISSAKLTLSYPVYSCDFDPQDPSQLVVGGGGGAGRSGVGNKISLLDTSFEEEIQCISEIELSRDEDSVTTLAVGLRKGRTTLVYAGINSSPDNIQKGKNEHFRVFGIDPPPRSKSDAGPKITELSRSILFTSNDADTYQRVLRLAPSYSGNHQVGAVATGLAKAAEITVFNASTTAGVGPKPSGKLELTKEAMDLDIIQVDEEKWQLAYCEDYDLHLMDITKGTTDDPACAFAMPDDFATGSGRPSFRSIRYLTPRFLMAASNLPKASGAVLQGLRLPPSPTSKARLAVSAKLPKSVTRVTGLAVRNLSPLATPSAKQGDTQFVIAVAAQDNSITLYAMDHQSMAEIELIANLYPITTLKAVHPSPISGLAFSHFSPSKTTTHLQTLKLASVGSMGNTVVVHTLPLRRLPTPTITATATARRGAVPPRPPRYVVALKSRTPSPAVLVIVSAFVIALLGALLQGVLEVKGLTRPVIGARHAVPTAWVRPPRPNANWLDTEDITPDGTHGFLAEFLAKQRLGQGGGKVVLSAGDGADSAAEDGAGPAVKVHTHDEEKHGDAKEWEELPPVQKAAWKDRLKKAGQWGEEMGETIFKGILFSEIGGAIGQMAGG